MTSFGVSSRSYLSSGLALFSPWAKGLCYPTSCFLVARRRASWNSQQTNVWKATAGFRPHPITGPYGVRITQASLHRRLIRRIHRHASVAAATNVTESWEHITCRTILVRSPSATILPEILDRLPVIQSGGYGHLQVVFLLTPSLAELFRKPTSFLGGALGHIFSQLTSSRSTAVECDLLAAVVDRLPGPLAFFEPNQSDHCTPENGLEGISVLVAKSPPERAIDNLSQADLRTSHKEVNTEMPSHISVLFPFKCAGNLTKRMILDIPLANTFLQTGRQLTMDVSRWRLETESNEWVRSRTLENPKMQVRLPQIPVGHQIAGCLHIPVVPVTAPRRIADIYGNILRRLEMNGQDAVPASQELERRLDAYFRSQGWRAQPANVWALILPHEYIQEGSEGRLSYHGSQATVPLLDAEAVQKTWSMKDSRSETQISELIANGARLNRVLSGGGGWGRKQGLLSLDPEAGYSHGSETFSSSAMEGEALGGILRQVAAAGDYIQFFLSPPPLDLAPAHELFTTESDFSSNTGDFTRPISLLFGATESIVDAVPPETIGSQLYLTLDGCFGALSGQGMVVTMDSINPSMEIDRSSTSKIDVPFSTFSVRNPPRKEAAGKLDR